MRYLSVPDLHFKNTELSDQLFDRILQAADKHEVNLVAFVGDFFDGPIMASDKGGINKCRSFFKKLSLICPSVAIYGTPSHEPPGSLDIFEDCGLTVLRPAKAYGFYFSDVGEPKIVPLNINSGYMNPDALLFGVPELNKKSLDFLPAQEGNAKIEDAFRVYVREFIAPIRLKHANIPAFGFLHGNVSGSLRENCTDLVLKSASILIHDEDLAPANLTRWSLGHIHKPWESTRINAGYAGSWGTSWGETGFIPAFHLIEDDKQPVRIPYGTPERIKITAPMDIYDPEVAYWLDTDDPDIPPPQGHPWSRKTCVPAKKTASRVDGDTRTMSLLDLFKAIDPTVPESVQKKISDLESKTQKTRFDALDVSVDKVEIDGCIFFGTPIVFDISSVEKHLSLIFGDNGAGKSSLLAFCSPYPVIIGKDTRSGRASAIKDFFPEGGTIKKTLTVNGKKHEHFLSVGKYKTECYLSIEGIPQLDKGTFDELMTMCESLYGPFADYVLTTFYVQPLQGKSGTSLMSAGMTEIRNLVQNIAGIDREKEKDFCLAQVNELQDKISKIESWLSAALDFMVDIEAEQNKKTVLESELVSSKTERTTAESIVSTHQAELDRLNTIKIKNESESKRKQDNCNKISTLQSDIKTKQARIASFDNLVSKLDENRAILADYEQNEKNIIENVKTRSEYDKKYSEWTSKKQTHEYSQAKYKTDFVNTVNDINARIGQLRNEQTNLERENQLLNKPCVKCGYVDETNQAKIDTNKIRLSGIPDLIMDLTLSIPPKYSEIVFDEHAPGVPEYLAVEPQPNIDVVKKDIELAVSSGNLVIEIQESIKKIEADIQTLTGEQYDIDETVTSKYFEQVSILTQAKDSAVNIVSRIFGIVSQIERIESVIQKAEQEKQNVSIKQTELAALNSDLTDYSYMAKMLQPAKIPALELDFFISAIDIEASRILENFDDARYSVTTETQQVGKKDIVDKFDIKIHDNETGADKSFLEWNPGHKAFFNDAYIKALIKQRNERMNRKYNPIILDEADGPIQPERIKDFYTIQRREYQGYKVLAVSHSPTCHEHIESIINIKELKR